MSPILVGEIPRHIYCFVDTRHTHSEPIGFVPVVWYGLVSYPGRMWGCTVMLESGAVYRNVPAHAMAFDVEPEDPWTPSDAQTWDCFDSETEVLAECGWVGFSELAKGERLATVNLLTNELEYQTPTAYIARLHHGEMVKISGGPRQTVDLLVTPNHRMVIYPRGSRVPRIVPASDLEMSHRLRLNVAWRGDDSKEIAIQPSRLEPEAIVDAEDLAEWLGWYVAEGFCRERGNSVEVGISQTDGPKAEALEVLLKKLPWRYHRHGNNFVYYQRQVFDLVCGLGDVASKRAPGWIRRASPRVIRAFLRGAILGDGWHDGALARYASISRGLAGDVQELFIKCGHRATLRHRRAKPYLIRGRAGDDTKDQFWAVQSSRVNSSLCTADRKPLFRTIAYRGMVYCATVPNGTLIVRRNGKPAVCGNCYGWQFSALEYSFLRGLDCRVKAAGRKHAGEYLFTVAPVGDGFSAYPEQAKEFTFAKLDNGRLTIQPTNHVIFRERSFTTNDAMEFPTGLRRQADVWTAE